MNIVMLEPLAVGEELLRALAAPLEAQGHRVTLCTAPLDMEEKRRRIPGAEALIVANSPLPGELIRLGESLRMISVGFTGVDHVDLETCARQGIRVCNAKGYATDATAELAVGLMLACLRHLPAYDAAARRGGVAREQVNHTLRGKTVGILGLGAIGSRVAELVGSFGCEVLAWSRRGVPGQREGEIAFVTLEELFARSDILTLHVPLTAETRGLVSRERLETMKPSAVLINCARGGVVDAAALAEALDTGRIAAAGLDVFDTEPPLPPSDPLLGARNTVLTPHSGFYTAESMEARAGIVFENVSAWLAGSPVNVVL